MAKKTIIKITAPRRGLGDFIRGVAIVTALGTAGLFCANHLPRYREIEREIKELERPQIEETIPEDPQIEYSPDEQETLEDSTDIAYQNFSQLEPTKAFIKNTNNKLSEEEIDQYASYFTKASRDYKIPLDLLLGIAKKETGFRNILGDNGYSKGIMQIWDPTKKDLIREATRIGDYNLAERLRGDLRKDPEAGIRAATLYLKMLNVQEDHIRAVNKYNVGPNTKRFNKKYVKSVIDHADEYLDIAN